ncbi:MAG: PKD domain-containing protein [Caldilineaceae bacterium]|jgi:PKD repeat protein
MRLFSQTDKPAQENTSARILYPYFAYFRSTPYAMLLGIILLANSASAAEVTLAWDPVAYESALVFELHYGQQSGQYDSQVTSTTTTATVTALTQGETYYFAVRACDLARNMCSAFSQEVTATLAENVAAPVTPDFSASQTTGIVPLKVSFSDQSTGEINDWLWVFGDGTRSDAQSPSHIYLEPGTYTVSLTTSGPDSSDTVTKTGLVDVGWPTPIADFKANPSTGQSPLVVIFSDVSSGNITDRLWDFGNGTTGSGTKASVEYQAPGSYSVTLTVTGPGGSTTKSNVVVVTEPAPTANFSADVTSGPAPLAVSFADQSSGQVSSWQWDFGDGAGSDQPNPHHTYMKPGQYSVSLKATGGGGSDTLTKTAFVQVTEANFAWEAGELTVDDVWQRIEFGQTYSDPVVVAKPLGKLDGGDPDPAVVRLDGIDDTGCWIRIQEWDYLDGSHTPETVSYLVMESGTHQLPDGIWVEAGRIKTDAIGDFAAVDFSAPFLTAPAVLTSIVSFVEMDAVTAQVRNVTEGGFEVRMSEQQANDPEHAVEKIDFIAWSASSGILDGFRYEVGVTDVDVDYTPHSTYAIRFESDFVTPPVFLADTQTTNQDDPYGLRLKSKTSKEASVMIEEEQSKNNETWAHRKEAVGYILLEAL